MNKKKNESNDTAGYPKLTKTILADKVAKLIYDRIASGELKPGDKLPGEIDFSEWVGVARTTVREAFGQLIGLGLIERREYGMYVAKEPTTTVKSSLAPMLLENWEIRKLYEARMILEAEFAVLAASKASKLDIESLKELNNQLLSKCDTEKSYWEKDMAFHEKIAEIADNEILFSMRSTIYTLFERYEKSVMELDPIKNATYKWHADLIEAIEKKDFNKVRKSVYVSLQESEKALYTYRLKQHDVNGEVKT